MTDKPAFSHLFWIDLIRVVACFAVVLLHVCAVPILSQQLISEHAIAWWSANIFRSITVIGVPLFFMVSGFLLLQKDEPIQRFYAKRASKVLIPFLFWVIFYHFAILVGKNQPWDGQLFFYNIRNGFKTGLSVHLWFLYALLSVYVIVPFLRKYVSAADDKNILCLLCLWFAVHSLYSTKPFNHGFYTEMITQYTGYFLLGHYLGKFIPTKRDVFFFLMAFFALWVITMGVAYHVLIRGIDLRFAYGVLAPNVVVMSSLSFLCLRYFGNIVQKSPWAKTITFLSSLSFGIYLVHPVFLHMIHPYSMELSLRYEYLSLPTYLLAAVCAFAMSAFTVWLIRKIPGGRWITP